MSNEKDIIFRENTFAGDMEKLRAIVANEVSELATKHNKGDIDRRQFEIAKAVLMDNAGEVRRDIIGKRQEAVKEAGIAIDQKMSNSEDVTKFRETFEKLSQLDKEQLQEHYQTSLRVNDKIALRANALVAGDKKIPAILNDYGKRDPEFIQHYKEREALKKRYNDPENKMIDQLSTYRSIMPPKETVKQVEAGRFLDQQAGQWRKYYKDKITVGK